MNYKHIFLLLIIFQSCILPAQVDTASHFGTIKVGGSKVNVKASTSFALFANGKRYGAEYQSFVSDGYFDNKPGNKMPRYIKVDTRPGIASDSAFDYTSYFRENKYTKDIHLRPNETDTVSIMVYVDKKGVVSYQDIVVSEKRAGDLWIYDRTKKSFKVDVVHAKTMAAFKELAAENWIPAKVTILKKHPSKKKNKYDSEIVISEGLLTIIYSNAPFKEGDHAR